MAKYRPYAPATPAPARPRTTPHRTHTNWDPRCDLCTADQIRKAKSVIAKRQDPYGGETARTMRTAPGYGR